MDPNPTPPPASALDSAVTSSIDPETTSGLGATAKVGGITPRWLYHPGTDTGTGSQVTCMAALGPKEESQPEAPQAPGDVPPAESSPTSAGAWERSKGRKWMEGTGPHLILISFWGFSKGKKPFKRKGPFLFLLTKWEAGFIEKTSELQGPREPSG